jgi:hypothetical protein
VLRESGEDLSLGLIAWPGIVMVRTGTVRVPDRTGRNRRGSLLEKQGVENGIVRRTVAWMGPLIGTVKGSGLEFRKGNGQ